MSFSNVISILLPFPALLFLLWLSGILPEKEEAERIAERLAALSAEEDLHRILFFLRIPLPLTLFQLLRAFLSIFIGLLLKEDAALCIILSVSLFRLFYLPLALLFHFRIRRCRNDLRKTIRDILLYRTMLPLRQSIEFAATDESFFSEEFRDLAQSMKKRRSRKNFRAFSDRYPEIEELAVYMDLLAEDDPQKEKELLLSLYEEQ